MLLHRLCYFRFVIVTLPFEAAKEKKRTMLKTSEQ